jgi:hypothetical protein
MQIVQEVCKRPGLNKAAFDMPAIYIPSLTVKVQSSTIISTSCLRHIV